jgi:hypothetical protein
MKMLGQVIVGIEFSKGFRCSEILCYGFMAGIFERFVAIVVFSTLFPWPIGRAITKLFGLRVGDKTI